TRDNRVGITALHDGTTARRHVTRKGTSALCVPTSSGRDHRPSARSWHASAAAPATRAPEGTPTLIPARGWPRAHVTTPAQCRGSGGTAAVHFGSLPPRC